MNAYETNTPKTRKIKVPRVFQCYIIGFYKCHIEQFKFREEGGFTPYRYT